MAFAFDLQLFADPVPKEWVSGTTLTMGDMNEGEEFILQDGTGTPYATLKKENGDDWNYSLTLKQDHIADLKNIDLQAAGTDNVLVTVENASSTAYEALSKVIFTLSGGGSLKGVEAGILGTTLSRYLTGDLTLLHGDFRMGSKDDRMCIIKIETTDAVTLAWKTSDSYSEPDHQVRVEALGGGSPAKATYTYGCFTQPNENAKITVEEALTNGQPSSQNFVKGVGSTSTVFVAYKGAVIKGDGSGNAIPCGGTFERSDGSAYGQVIQVAATEADVVFRGVRYQWIGSALDRHNSEDRVIFWKGAEGTIQNLSESYSKPLEITLKKGSISTGMAAGIAENPESETADNTIRITLANGGAILAENGDFDVSSGGLVSGMDTGETLSIGTETYRAAADGTKIQYMAKNLGSLQAGAVDLQKGGSIYIGGAGCKVTLAEGEADCTVAANGSITGLSEGNRLVLEQDGETYEGIVSEGKFSVTKDGVTKSCSLNDEGSIAEGALEKVLDEMVEELYALDPSKPQTIRTTPGQTKTPEAYNPKKDTVRISQASGALDATKLILTEDGLLTYGDSFAQGLAENGAVDLSKAEQDKTYYTANLTDKDGKNPQMAAWSGTRSAVVDMRGETKGVIMKDGGNGKQDIFLGGKGNDNITLGKDDVAAGGKGDDDITMGADASGAEVVFKDGDGHDKVEDFRFGFGEDANAVSLPGGEGIFGISVDSRGCLKVGDATLDFTGTSLATSGQTDLLLKDSNGTHKAAIGTSLTAEEDPADFYYGIGKDVEVDFSGIHDDLVIDLSNSNALGDSAAYYNVSKARAGEGSVVMVGSKKTATILQAGSGGSSLWGGSRDSDSLLGGAGKDFFALSSAGGEDKVSDFRAGSESNSDVVYFLGNVKLSKVAKSSAGVIFTLSDGSSLTLRSNDSLSDDEKIAFSWDGEHVSYGKVGRSGQASEFTYSDDVGAYVGGKAGSSLIVAGSEDALVWLDGAAGVGYSNINRVDGSGSTGNLIIGGTSSKDVILGGSGSNTLWGGAGDDTLTGGTGCNEFYFGRGEGCDIITSSNNGDKVMLYNVALEDLDPARTGMDAKGNMVVHLTDGSSLTIRNYGAQGATTFQLADSTWNYDRESGSWSQE